MGLTLCLLIISLFGYCLCFPFASNNTDIQLPCPDYGKIDNAKVKTYNLENFAAVVYIECEPGYELDGKEKSFRNFCKDGQWVNLPRPKCITKDRCTNPPNIDNGILTIEGEKDQGSFYKKGTLVTYICNDGYRLSPPESKYRVCEKTIWTGAMGKCIPMGCESPKEIENGYFVLDKNGLDQNIYVDQRVYYSCSTGYVLVGPPMQQCIDGSWTPRKPPFCTLEINGKLIIVLFAM